MENQPVDSPLASEAPASVSTRDIKPLLTMLSFLRPYGARVAAAAFALVVAASGVLAVGQGLRLVVDRGFASGDPQLLNRMLLVTLAIVGVMAIATAVRFFLVSWIGERIAADLRLAVFNHVLTLDPGFYETNQVGELQSRITTDTTLLETVFGSSLSIAIRNVFMLIGGIIMLIITSPKLALLVLLGVPLVVFPILIYGRRVRQLSRRSQDRVADVGSYVNETLHAIRTVQAFVHEPVDRIRFRERVEQAFAVAIRRIRQRSILTGMVILLVFSAVGIILWIGGRDVMAGQVSVGELSAFVFYAMLVAAAVGAISEVIGDLLRGVGAAERMLELLASEPRIKAPINPTTLPTPAAGRVCLEQVRFHYPSRLEVAALDGLNLQVEPGERLALVGPSGAGKSTVFQLILRFYDPNQGRLLFDGVDLRAAAPAELRSRIGLVSQEPVLFAADAWENIRYGCANASEQDVIGAAQAAHAHEFLERLPEGYNSFLGERGVRLSGGQRQRIAIARAILRDPALLLLDEATSALDAESEQKVQQALDTLMQGRTSIVIAHRLATVLKADRIAVMDHGTIHAIGTHHQLLKQSTLYARLAALQFGDEHLKGSIGGV